VSDRINSTDYTISPLIVVTATKKSVRDNRKRKGKPKAHKHTKKLEGDNEENSQHKGHLVDSKA